MTEELILSELRGIRARLDSFKPDLSPWIKGDLSAAKYAGYRTAKAFLKWARSNGIKPSVDGCNFWSRADISKAREKGKL